MTAVTGANRRRGGRSLLGALRPHAHQSYRDVPRLQKNNHEGRVRHGKTRRKLRFHYHTECFSGETRIPTTRHTTNSSFSRLGATTTPPKTAPTAAGSRIAGGAKGLHGRRRPEIRQGGLQGQGACFGGCRQVEQRRSASASAASLLTRQPRLGSAARRGLTVRTLGLPVREGPATDVR